MAREFGKTIMGTSGPDELQGTDYADSIYGYEGNDLLDGAGGNDTLMAHDGNDRLYGRAGDDTLYGGFGDDVLDGGTGNDRLWGGPGNDRLTGGDGADLFNFSALYWTDQMQGVALITDFQSGTDMIDLSRFDADERTAPGTIKGKNTPGNEAFQLVQSTDEVTPGHLVIKPGVDAFGNPVTMVLGYTDTETGPDIVIYLGGSPPITAADFIF